MDIITLALAKKYVDEVVAGSGVRAGKNCTIQSITPVDGGNNVVFAWTNDDGTAATQTLFVANGVDGRNGIDGTDGVSVTHNWNGTILEVTSASGTSSADLKGETGAQGAQGLRGEKGEKGETGAQGIQGIQGIQGEKGEDGYPFLIYKEYADISEFNADHFPEIGLMFMINDGVAGSDKPIYRFTGDADNPYTHVTDMATAEGLKGEKGDKGDQGEQGVAGANGIDGADGTTYTPEIGTVTTVDSAQQAAASVDIDEDTKRAVFHFSIPKGEDGQDGADAPQIDDTAISEDSTWSSKQITGGVANVPVTSIGSVENTTNFGLGSANHFYTVKNGVCYFQLYLLVKTPAGTMTIVRQGLPKPLDGQIQYWAFPPYNGAADLTPLRFAIEANGQAKAAFGATNGQYMCHGSYPVA